jgi:hypothetical protein
MRSITLTLALCLSAPTLARGQTPDLAWERAELLRLHAADREAHFRTDAKLLMEGSGNEMISVRDGQVRRISKAQRLAVLADYFRGARYQEWDDLEEPIVHLSRDASMAWMITRLKVRRLQRDSSGVDG